MLEELLRMLRAGQTLSLPEIASHLQTSEALAGMMLAELERMGLLEPLGACAQGSCAGCSLGTVCEKGSQAKVWGSKARPEPQPDALLPILRQSLEK